MDHVVYLDAKANELENLVKGNKSMIIRGAAGRKFPHGGVTEGDILYFINDNGEKDIKARGVVSSVSEYDQLSVDESFETIIRHQEKLQLPDDQFDKVAGSPFLVIIGVDKIEAVKPIHIDISNFMDMDDWIPVDKIEMVALRQSRVV